MAGKKYRGYIVKFSRGYDDLFFKFSFDNKIAMMSLIDLFTNHNIENPNRKEEDRKLEITIELYEEEEDEV